MKNNLNENRFVSLLTDASNHGNVKMFPVLVRYFMPLDGVKLKVVQLTNESNKKSISITELISTAANTFDLNFFFLDLVLI